MPSVIGTLQALVVELRATNAGQQATILELRAANVRLEERVRDHSVVWSCGCGVVRRHHVGGRLYGEHTALGSCQCCFGNGRVRVVAFSVAAFDRGTCHQSDSSGVLGRVSNRGNQATPVK